MYHSISAPARPATGPPEAIDDPPLTIAAAAALMGRFGFVAFRTPPGSAMPDSCVMALLRDRPTLVHFDPEVVSYWAFADGRGRLVAIDRTTPAPADRPFSWGRIRLTDRLGMRNSFVTFGGRVTATSVGSDALLVAFRSAAPILRLPGHSQRQDPLAQDVVAFFGRVVPRLWDPATNEQLVGGTPPEVLYGAFLLHERDRLQRGEAELRELNGSQARIHRALRELEAARPSAVSAGRAVLAELGLGTEVER